jgi:hypothetical protein
MEHETTKPFFWLRNHYSVSKRKWTLKLWFLTISNLEKEYDYIPNEKIEKMLKSD